MYDIRQFRPVLYALVILGFAGYGVAFHAPLMWVVATGLGLINGMAVRAGRFRPMPRWFAGLVTLGGLVFVVMHSELDPARFIGSIAQFLVMLQLVKLFEQRANRDYGQILILSLLMMVAGCISTASLLFALILAMYLCLSLFCCLLFHLKVEAERARANVGAPTVANNPLTLRQDERFLAGSMRRLTWRIAGWSLAGALLVFLFFPRGSGAAIFAGLQFRSAQTLTGFSHEVSFEQIASITQSDAVVAHVKVWRGDTPVGAGEPLLLRGITMDVYGGSGGELEPAWSWLRSATVGRVKGEVRPGVAFPGADPGPRPIRQEVTLEPTGTPVLFAEAGPCMIKPRSSELTVLYSPRDSVVQLERVPAQEISYEVVSSGLLREAPRGSAGADEYPPMVTEAGSDGVTPPMPGGPRFHLHHERHSHMPNLYVDTAGSSAIDPQIAAIAKRADVSGSDAKGPLAARRDPTVRVTALDKQIAANIERYLRSPPFSYTLDLTDAQRPKDRDPMVWFLTDTHRGHCEYFAGAMALMCQSLGLQARVVVGFRCDEFNPFSEAYVVRQSHAHAWVEVLDDRGFWDTYDPTTSRLSETAARQVSLWTRAEQFVDFLDYTWARSVVAYDSQSHDNVMNAVATRLAVGRDGGVHAADRMRQWLSSINVDAIATMAITPVLTLFVLALIGAVAWYVIERWMLRRRARRIGIAALPKEDRVRLARQLRFYDELVRLLERHRIVRPAHQTPLEFSASITYLPRGVYDAIRRVTEIFYRVRFGKRALSSAQRRRLDNVISRIAADLRARS